MAYLRSECVFILEHFFVSISFAGVGETVISTCSDKEIPNKTTLHRLLTFEIEEVFVCDKGSLSDKRAKLRT